MGVYLVKGIATVPVTGVDDISGEFVELSNEDTRDPPFVLRIGTIRMTAATHVREYC